DPRASAQRPRRHGAAARAELAGSAISRLARSTARRLICRHAPTSGACRAVFLTYPLTSAAASDPGGTAPLRLARVFARTAAFWLPDLNTVFIDDIGEKHDVESA